MTTLLAAGNHRVAERRFYTGTAFIMLGSVFLGFSRTFFSEALVPEAAVLAPPEPFFFCYRGNSCRRFAEPQLLSSPL